MSSLIVVRHAQASFFADDYDQLSEMGQAQARRLGEYWLRHKVSFDEVYAGPRQRQQHTAEIIAACYRQAGLPWPEPVVHADFDEYDLAGFLARLLPGLTARDESFARLVTQYRGSNGNSEEARGFQRMFEALMRHWQQAPAEEGVEAWPAFRQRVERGLATIFERPGQGRRVALFTSGGFIGTAVHLALQAPDAAALEINWRIRNCSLTEFIFTRGRVTLDAFNAVPHLEPALWTYR